MTSEKTVPTAQTVLRAAGDKPQLGKMIQSKLGDTGASLNVDQDKNKNKAALASA